MNLYEFDSFGRVMATIWRPKPRRGKINLTDLEKGDIITLIEGDGK